MILEIPPEEESRGDLSTIERAGSSSGESEHVELELARVRNTELETELERACEANRVTTEENTKLLEEVSKLQDKLRGEKSKYSSLWRMYCEQLTEYDDTLASKEEELKRLHARLVAL